MPPKKKTTKTPIIQQTLAEQICQNVNGDIRAQAVTLTNAVLAMQEKIEQQIPIYKKMPLAQQVTVGTGEKMLRANPAVQEFRATVRDYAQALSNLRSIIDNNSAPAETSSLDDLRSKFKMAK
jgi:hypothetical protein